MREPKQKIIDKRGIALGHIGWISTAFIIFSIPLVAILQNSFPTAAILIPLSIIGGAIGSGILVWSKGGPVMPEPESNSQIEVLQETIKSLEHRIENLETINSYEHKLAERNWTKRIVAKEPDRPPAIGGSSDSVPS